MLTDSASAVLLTNMSSVLNSSSSIVNGSDGMAATAAAPQAVAAVGTDIVAITLFATVLCLCIVVGHLMEEVRWINESVTAVIFGLLSGVVVLFFSRGKRSTILQFDEELFFIYLLPPIIFNAGFQVKKKQFFRNFAGIMAYGILGVFISFAVISAGAQISFDLLGLPPLRTKDFMALGVIFSATDSVCVLQVLDQDEQPLLYSLVFGEGVVNDATSVVLFRAVHKFQYDAFTAGTTLGILADFLYLFTASTSFGILIGLASAFIIKTLYFGRHSTDREIALMVLMAYLSYIISEILELSGILAVFFCGIVMSHYTWHNVTESSRVTTKHSFASMSYIAETFIFLYVGMDALDLGKWQKVPSWSAGWVFAIFILLTLLGRAAFVFPLSSLLNMRRRSDRVISLKQQVIIWWAGLMRGAVSIALTYSAFPNDDSDTGQRIVVASTICVVLFSTLVFGLLTKPLIDVLFPHPSYECDTPPHDMDSPKRIHPINISGPDEDGNVSDPWGAGGRGGGGGGGFYHPLAGGEIETIHVMPSKGMVAAAERISLVESLPCLPSGGPLPMSLQLPETKLARLLTAKERDVHDLWRWFDDSYMRPYFGGRGFMPVLPASPTMVSMADPEGIEPMKRNFSGKRRSSFSDAKFRSSGLLSSKANAAVEEEVEVKEEVEEGPKPKRLSAKEAGKGFLELGENDEAEAGLAGEDAWPASERHHGQRGVDESAWEGLADSEAAWPANDHQSSPK